MGKVIKYFEMFYLSKESYGLNRINWMEIIVECIFLGLFFQSGFALVSNVMNIICVVCTIYIFLTQFTLSNRMGIFYTLKLSNKKRVAYIYSQFIVGEICTVIGIKLFFLLLTKISGAEMAAIEKFQVSKSGMVYIGVVIVTVHIWLIASCFIRTMECRVLWIILGSVVLLTYNATLAANSIINVIGPSSITIQNIVSYSKNAGFIYLLKDIAGTPFYLAIGCLLAIIMISGALWMSLRQIAYKCPRNVVE